MEIGFADKNLELYANNDKKRRQKLGQIQGDIFKRRLDELTSADALEDVRFLPGHYHELIGDKKGLWACNLNNPYRLIFCPQENPIPIDFAGKYNWKEIRSINIIEICDYH